jgi:hypothetical protein
LPKESIINTTTPITHGFLLLRSKRTIKENTNVKYKAGVNDIILKRK